MIRRNRIDEEGGNLSHVFTDDQEWRKLLYFRSPSVTATLLGPLLLLLLLETTD